MKYDKCHVLVVFQVLEGLEGNIADYERKTGRQPATATKLPDSFSGYTVALVNAVSRLTTHLKEVHFI